MKRHDLLDGTKQTADPVISIAVRCFLRMERHGKHIMCSTQHFSITWPNQMGEAVKAKVATGEYPTENEVIRDGLRALRARDREIEGWLVG